MAGSTAPGLEVRLGVRLGLGLALGLLTTPAWADNCEALRSSIETKIRASGVQDFSVTVIAAGAHAPGRIVGRCAQGTRQIVYRRGAVAAAASQPPGNRAPAKPAPPMLTECRDGRVIVAGDCRR